jgi:hypothetical protein
MNVSDLFKKYDGMTVEGSTVEERHEIWELLFDKELIYDQDSTIEIEHFALGNYEFYFCDLDNLFVIGFFPCCKNNISLEDFKNRLSQLND